MYDHEHWDIGKLHAKANQFLKMIIANREIEMRQIECFQGHPDSKAVTVQQTAEFLSPILKRPLSYLTHGLLPPDDALPPVLVPLNDCILAIRWEFSNMIGELVSDGTSQIFVLLRAAALYQANFESVCTCTLPVASAKESY
jgi:hypothetical protein